MAREESYACWAKSSGNWRVVGGDPSQAYLQKLDHIHRPLGSQVWRGVLFGGGLGFGMQQSQSWRGTGA